MWYLIFLLSTIMNIWSLAYPFLIEFEAKFNVLRMKGVISLKLFNKIKIQFKIRFKNGYGYIYFKKKEKKIKLTNKDFNFILIKNVVQQLYYRQQIINLNLSSNYGFVLNSCATAIVCGYFDVLTKCLLSKVKNNKKYAHILVNIEPKYNEDVFNAKIKTTFRISLFDIIFALIYTIINSWGKYERKRKSAAK